MSVVDAFDPGFWLTLISSLLALVFVAVYRERPKCPACGSLRSSATKGFPHVRQCLGCNQLYDIR